MMKKMSFYTLFAAIFAGGVGYANEKIESFSGKVWRKGALHCHTLWSDGRSLPETAVMTYKNLGYAFMCISDHNIYPDEELWLPVMPETGPWPCSLGVNEYNHAMKLMDGNLVTKKISFRRYVKLRTFKELQGLFDQENQFLIVPGEEITLRDFHFNTFNIAQTLPPLASENVAEAIKLNFDRYRQVAKGKEQTSFFMVNHPFYSAWAVDPMALVNNPDITHVEICNNNMAKDFPHVFTPDQFWDFILAHRLDRGQNIIYATASDDAHFYIDAVGKYAGNNLGYVMVNCPGKMTADALAKALNRGDFYSTSGVELEKLELDSNTKTLTVKAKTEKGVKYQIVFITTKKNFDRSIVYREYSDPGKRYIRQLPVIPDSIGTTALMVEGPEGSYTLKDDDLYVRAIVISDKKSQFQGIPYPETERAWTQPLVNQNLSSKR